MEEIWINWRGAEAPDGCASIAPLLKFETNIGNCRKPNTRVETKREQDHFTKRRKGHFVVDGVVSVSACMRQALKISYFLIHEVNERYRRFFLLCYFNCFAFDCAFRHGEEKRKQRIEFMGYSRSWAFNKYEKKSLFAVKQH